MLLDIKHYLMRHQSATLSELAMHFRESPENLRCMLAHWERKGKVCCTKKTVNCGDKCALCPTEVTEIYQWVM